MNELDLNQLISRIQKSDEQIMLTDLSWKVIAVSRGFCLKFFVDPTLANELVNINLLEFIINHPKYLNIQLNWVFEADKWLLSNYPSDNHSYLYDINQESFCHVWHKLIEVHGNKYKVVIGQDLYTNFNASLVNSLYIRYGNFYFEEVKVFTDIELSFRGLQVIELLLCGYNLKEVANILKISYSYCSKFIGEELCSKFQVDGYSSRQLLDKLIAIKFYSFINPKLVLTNTNFTQYYFHRDTKEAIILELVRNNFTQQEIAKHLSISNQQVFNLIQKNLLPKFQVNDFQELKLILKQNMDN